MMWSTISGRATGASRSSPRRNTAPAVSASRSIRSLVELSWRIANEAEVAHRVSFIVGDLFTADLSKATVVTTYLSQSIMKLLEPKLRALAPGTRIVAHHFPMVGWPPDRRIKVDEAELMLWIVPASA